MPPQRGRRSWRWTLTKPQSMDFSSAGGERANILPIVGNFASPSPALGGQTERQCRFSIVLRDASIRRCYSRSFITCGPPAEFRSNALRDRGGVTRKHVLVEHVPVEDPMFQRLSRGRDQPLRRLFARGFRSDLEPPIRHLGDAHPSQRQNPVPRDQTPLRAGTRAPRRALDSQPLRWFTHRAAARRKSLSQKGIATVDSLGSWR